MNGKERLRGKIERRNIRDWRGNRIKREKSDGEKKRKRRMERVS